jgi:hypothetical protein
MGKQVKIVTPKSSGIYAGAPKQATPTPVQPPAPAHNRPTGKDPWSPAKKG